VAEILGHKHVRMTMRHAHLAPAHNRAAVEQRHAYNKTQQSAILGVSQGGAIESGTGTDGKEGVSGSFPRNDARSLESIA